MKPRIAVVSTSSTLLDNNYKHIVALELPLLAEESGDYDYFIHVKNDDVFISSSLVDISGHFRIDFIAGKTGYRWRSQEGKRQPIARAVGLHQKSGLHIVDVTAGMGRDALVLANLGAQVSLCERSPVLAALLGTALELAQNEPEIADTISRMHLYATDALSWMASLNEDEFPDVIYMDPMYPHRSKSALVKKEMRFIRGLVGDDEDADVVLQQALSRAKRVVVKRPKGAPLVAGLKPSHMIESKNTRYDVYCR